MGGHYYITKQGDMWDFIAFQIYGDEYMVSVLYEANPQYLTEYIFEAGCRLWCPETDSVDEETDAPDWRDEPDEYTE